jgi:hypothetical protein
MSPMCCKSTQSRPLSPAVWFLYERPDSAPEPPVPPQDPRKVCRLGRSSGAGGFAITVKNPYLRKMFSVPYIVFSTFPSSYHAKRGGLSTYKVAPVYP